MPTRRLSRSNNTRGSERSLKPKKTRRQKQKLKKDIANLFAGEKHASSSRETPIDDGSSSTTRSGDDESTTNGSEMLDAVQPKSNKVLEGEVMDAYRKVRILYDHDVDTVGYDHLNPNPVRYKPRQVTLPHLPPPPHDGCSDLELPLIVAPDVPTVPLTLIRTLPHKRYYTKTTVNVHMDDQHALSHIPYISDNIDDSAFVTELMNTFEEGIHGTSDGCGEFINDYILFHTVDRVLQRHKWSYDSEQLSWVINAVYNLFPNKESARKMTNGFNDLVMRFAFHKAPIKPKRLYDLFGELTTEVMPDPLCSSTHNLLCPRCFMFDCPIHSSELTSNDHPVERVNNARADFKPIAPCCEKCFMHLESGDSKPADSGDRRRRSSPRKRASQPLEVAVPVPAADDEDWSPHDKSVLRLLMTMWPENCCAWASGLLSISNSAPKTCRDVFLYTKTNIAPESPSKALKLRPDNKGTRLFQIAFDVHRAFRSKNSEGLRNENMYVACKHSGPCSTANNCQCLKTGIRCTKFCGCDMDCSYRFPGCRCTTGQCQTKHCPCYYAHWECDPDLCNCCKHEERGEGADHKKMTCFNLNVQRAAPYPVYVDVSTVAGYGCFAATDIPADGYVGEYVGELISHDEAERRGKVYDKLKCSYLFSLNKDQVVDATRCGNETRFINHSTNPNCYANIYVVNGAHHIALFAQGLIQTNEELFFDYSYNKAQRTQFVNKERHHITDRQQSTGSAASNTRKRKRRNESGSRETSVIAKRKYS